MILEEILKIFCDGGSRGNPGPSACAFVVKDNADNLLEKCGKYLGIGTNNEAEYAAVIEAWKFLQKILDLGKAPQVYFFLDSNLVVNQINGKFKVREPRMQKLLREVQKVQEKSQLKVTYAYVPREQNADADLVVNQTLDQTKN